MIVSGPAATGKTTLAKKLGEQTSLPAICKDDIKESLFETLGYDIVEWVEKLEVATNELLLFTATSILKASRSLIIETDISSQSMADSIKELMRKYDFDTLQIARRTDGDILTERFKQRAQSGGRHPGHYEMYYFNNYEEFRDSLKKATVKHLTWAVK